MKKIISFSPVFNRRSKLISMLALTIACAQGAGASTQPSPSSSLSSSPSLSPQGRFYVGAQLGVVHGEPSGNVVVNNNAGPPSNTMGDAQSFSQNNSALGVFGGYDYGLPFGFLSVEGFYNNEFSAYKKESLLRSAAFDTNLTTQLKKSNTCGLTTKVGWHLKKTPLIPYVSLSLLTSDFSFSYESIDIIGGGDEAEGKQSRNLWAFAPGAGLAYPINNRISLRLDYQYRFYQEWNLRNVNALRTLAGLTGSLRIRDQSLMIGAAYKL